MTSGPIEELSVPFDSGPATEKVRRRRRLLRSRLFSLAVTCVVLVVLYLWRGAEMNGAAIFVIYGLVLLVSVAWVVFYLVGYRRAKDELASIGVGTAVRIDRFGVEMAGTRTAWPDVVAVAAVRGGLGKSALLQVSRAGGEPLFLPLDQLDVRPATLDMVARAYSGGRHGVDLTALDS